MASIKFWVYSLAVSDFENNLAVVARLGGGPGFDVGDWLWG